MSLYDIVSRNIVCLGGKKVCGKCALGRGSEGLLLFSIPLPSTSIHQCLLASKSSLRNYFKLLLGNFGGKLKCLVGKLLDLTRLQQVHSQSLPGSPHLHLQEFCSLPVPQGHDIHQPLLKCSHLTLGITQLHHTRECMGEPHSEHGAHTYVYVASYDRDGVGSLVAEVLHTW